jgi:hypothetical protein
MKTKATVGRHVPGWAFSNDRLRELLTKGRAIKAKTRHPWEIAAL